MTSSSHFFRYLLFLGKQGPSKVRSVGTLWIWNLIQHSTSAPAQNLSKNTKKYVENTNKKVVFFNDKYVKSTIMVDSFLLKFYLFLNSNSSRNYGWLVFLYDGTVSYKAHFRPQISSNVCHFSLLVTQFISNACIANHLLMHFKS